MNEVFLDTSFAIALSSVTDRHHSQAMAIAAELTRQKTKLVTSLETDPNVTIVSLSTQLYSRALELFKTRLDKEWGLVDCISFTVMRDRNISDALLPMNTFHKLDFAGCCCNKLNGNSIAHHSNLLKRSRYCWAFSNA